MSIKKLFILVTKPLRIKIRGRKGENKVNRALNPIFFGKVPHYTINNIILMDENGKTHQIDHVEIRQNGVFCIETKNYSGNIYGAENQDNWVQFIANEKHQFLSPIKQNKSHIYHLNNKLEKQYKINPLIVFTGSRIKQIDCSYVIHLSQLKEYLKEYDDGTFYSEEEMNEIYNKIISISETNITNREHVKNLRKTQKDLQNKICPRCGGELVFKNGKYGAFWGCINYPKCKFTLKEKDRYACHS